MNNYLTTILRGINIIVTVSNIREVKTMSQVNAVAVRDEKPQVKIAASTQGAKALKAYSNYTPLGAGKARYERGIELYKQGKVSINSKGYFEVNGYQVDTEKVKCECPDYRNRKEPCKHFFAACLFQRKGTKAIGH